MVDNLKLKHNKALLVSLSKMGIQERAANKLSKHGFILAGDFLFYPAQHVSLIPGIGSTSINQVKEFLKPWGGDFGVLKSPWINPVDYCDPIEPYQRALLDTYLVDLYESGNLKVLTSLPNKFLGEFTQKSYRLYQEFLENVVFQVLGRKDEKIVNQLMKTSEITQAFGKAVSLTERAIDEMRVDTNQKPESPSEPSQG